MNEIVQLQCEICSHNPCHKCVLMPKNPDHKHVCYGCMK